MNTFARAIRTNNCMSTIVTAGTMESMAPDYIILWNNVEDMIVSLERYGIAVILLCY